MWTHKKPYKRLCTTQERIEYWGKQELYRALNLKRVVGFIGSGVTTAYGRLTWGEFCRLIVMSINELYQLKKSNQHHFHNKSHIDELYRGLTQACGQTPSTETYNISPTLDTEFSVDTALLELCSELADALGEPDFVKKETQRIMCANYLQQFEYRLILLQNKAKNSLYKEWRNSIEFFFNEQLFNFKEQPKKFQWNQLRESEKINCKQEKSIEQGVDYFFCQLEQSDNQKIIRKIIEYSNNKDIEVIENSLLKEGYLATIHVNIWRYLKKQTQEQRKIFFPLLFCLLLENKNSKKPWYIESFIDKKLISKIERNDQKWPHPIKHIIETLGIHRILTLNYDLEFEKYFKEERSFHTEPWFIDPIFSNEKMLSRNHTTLDGYGDRFYSVTPNQENVSDLIDFAALASHHDAYVFHLHGRADCENDLIITEYDYQQRYVKNDKIRRAFDEGMRTLFAGNDVLFIGIGMNEADLFRPMRQFISDGKRFMDHQDGIIALLGSNQFKDKYIKKKLKEKATNEKKSTQLKIQYGVKSLFYKNTIKKSTFSELKKNHIQPTPSPSSSVKKIEQQIEKQKKLLSLMYIDRQLNREQSNALINAIKKHEEVQQKWFKDWKRKPKDKFGLLRNWGKNNYTLWIRQRAISPEQNILRKDQLLMSGQEKSTNPILIQLRDTIINAYHSSKPSELIDNTSSQGRRIIRITGKKGIGKGTLIRVLQKSHCHFLPSINNLSKSQQYRAAFFVDTHYSTEFNSVISSFIRFIAGRLASIMLEKGLIVNKLSPEQVEHNPFDTEVQNTLCGNNFYRIGRLELLKRYIVQYANISNQITDRLFICLSGLDRIVDKKGDGYNALHRAFFRTLTGSGTMPNYLAPFNQTPPFDIILISGTQEAPIRYLSQYNIGKIPKNSKGKLIFDAQKAPLLSWYHLSTPVISIQKMSGAHFSELINHYPCLLELVNNNIFLGDLLYNFINSFTTLKGATKICEKLNFTASRDGKNGVLDIILHSYYEENLQKKGADWANLTSLILRRLVLFSLPIQRSVLTNFPAIYNILSKLFLKEPPPNFISDNFPTACELSEFLYQHILKPLEDKKLIIPIHDDGLGKIRNKEYNDSQPISSGSQVEKYKRYTLHSLIREHLAKRMRYAAFDHGEHSFFDVSLYISQPIDLPSPSTQDYREIGRVLQNIMEFCLNYFNPFYKWDRLERQKKLNKNQVKEKDKLKYQAIKKIFEYDTLHVATHKLRAGLNLVSGSFSIGVISRLYHGENDQLDFGGETLKPFDNYRSWIRGLLNAAIAIDEFDEIVYKIFNTLSPEEIEYLKNETNSTPQLQKNNIEDTQKFIQKYHIQKPFYRTEIAWLYNERGLVSLLQGRLFEAITFFDSALEQINDDQWACPEKGEIDSAASSYRRIILNRAIARLEAGKLEDTLNTLLSLHNKLEHKKRAIPNLTLYWIKGYLGLCHHLAGRKNTAKKYYNDAINYFEDQPSHMRTLAIFRRHLADLYRSFNQLDEARHLINQSITTATSADQQDILHHAFVSKARLIHISKGNIGNAISLLDKAELYAEKMGIYKLLVDCYTSKGEIMVNQKQFDTAGRYLTNAIAIANKHGMQLRKIAALKSYGDLLEVRGTDNKLLERVRFVTQAQSEQTGLLHTLEKPEINDRRAN